MKGIIPGMVLGMANVRAVRRMTAAEKKGQLVLDFAAMAAPKVAAEAAQAEAGRPNENARRVFDLLRLHEELGRVQQDYLEREKEEKEK